MSASFLATGGLVKLFHKIPWFFHGYSVFFKFHDFSEQGTFINDIPGLPWFPELVGTLIQDAQDYCAHRISVNIDFWWLISHICGPGIFQRPNLGPNIGPFPIQNWAKSSKPDVIYSQFPCSTFWWKFYENRTKNSKVTDVYIHIMMQIFMSNYKNQCIML